jgi:uncharacterized membrane protein YhaH (DUF805 family)
MSKKAILWLTLISIVLAIIGAVLVVPVATIVMQRCTQEQISAGTCQPHLAPNDTTRVSIGAALFGIAAILQLIAWIGALVRSGRMRTWGWFVAVLFLGTLGLLLYALFSPSDRARLPGGPQPPAGMPGYPPPVGQAGYPPTMYPPPNSPPYTYPPPGTNYPQQGSGYPPNAPTVPG